MGLCNHHILPLMKEEKNMLEEPISLVGNVRAFPKNSRTIESPQWWLVVLPAWKQRNANKPAWLKTKDWWSAKQTAKFPLKSNNSSSCRKTKMTHLMSISVCHRRILFHLEAATETVLNRQRKIRPMITCPKHRKKHFWELLSHGT